MNCRHPKGKRVIVRDGYSTEDTIGRWGPPSTDGEVCLQCHAYRFAHRKGLSYKDGLAIVRKAKWVRPPS